MSERWQRVKQIYQEALVRDPSLRKSYLFEACAGDETLLREVNELLQYDAQAEAQSFLGQPAIETPEGAALVTSISSAGTEKRFGPYEIHAILGEGGMGRVYDATDMRLGRRVALKVMRSEIAYSSEARGHLRRHNSALFT